MIQSDNGNAHYYQRQAWIHAFNSLPGYEAKLWWSNDTNAYDAFDSYEPDIFLGQTYNLNKSLMECISERPHLKVALRAPDWGSQVTDDRFRILKATDEEKKNVEELFRTTGQPSFLHIHYPEYALEETHDKWTETGVPVKSLMMCADVNSYAQARFVPELECDIGFVGGYWPYKGQVINKYFLPICNDRSLNVKIFGNQPWTETDRYCGTIEDSNVRHLFASAKICPNLSEPHAQEYGYDVNERVFKVLFCGGMCISDVVEGLARTFSGGGLSLASSPKDFEEKIHYFLENDEARKEVAERGKYHVIKNHTNFHRIEEILNGFGITEPSIKEYKDAIQ
jgi:hypothetical protein